MKFFDDLYEEKDVIGLISKSKPNADSKLSLLKISDKNGWVDILAKINDLNFSICYSSCMFDTAILIKYLAELINSNEEIVLVFDNEGSNPIFYSKPINKDTIRFVFASDYELYSACCNDEIDDYNLTDFKIECDIIVNKKDLLKEFYNILYPFTMNYNLKRAYYPEFDIENGKKYLSKIAEFLKE